MCSTLHVQYKPPEVKRIRDYGRMINAAAVREVEIPPTWILDFFFKDKLTSICTTVSDSDIRDVSKGKMGKIPKDCPETNRLWTELLTAGTRLLLCGKFGTHRAIVKFNGERLHDVNQSHNSLTVSVPAVGATILLNSVWQARYRKIPVHPI